MASKNRDINAVREIECPRCHAWPGHACFVHGAPGTSGRGLPACHQERRVANQERRRREGMAGPVQTPKGGAKLNETKTIVECFIRERGGEVTMNFAVADKATPEKPYDSVDAAKHSAQTFAFPYGAKSFDWDRIQFEDEGDTVVIHGQFERKA